MHEKYTTRGLVISSNAYREADKIVTIFTEDFGLVSAITTGVRRGVSKLRYHTQDYSARLFSLVRGRELWRLVGAEEASLSPLILGEEALAPYARVLSLVRRLVHGEEKNEGVFSTLWSLHAVLAMRDKKLDLSVLETLAVFRILHALGYIKSNASTRALIDPKEVDAALVSTAKPMAKSLVGEINRGLSESHL